ncbi:uncharacterized protein LOC132601910 [Lycium barbarum]|uniref:uncharacterized protein LOC132601910 n=1 Tax=Lycium barbarum TaxID=112863 RepID=UPI00293F6B4F|nr:uncharacterized protein LOC132601910 [Lycium barbarum]
MRGKKKSASEHTKDAPTEKAKPEESVSIKVAEQKVKHHQGNMMNYPAKILSSGITVGKLQSWTAKNDMRNKVEDTEEGNNGKKTVTPATQTKNTIQTHNKFNALTEGTEENKEEHTENNGLIEKEAEARDNFKKDVDTTKVSENKGVVDQGQAQKQGQVQETTNGKQGNGNTVDKVNGTESISEDGKKQTKWGDRVEEPECIEDEETQSISQEVSSLEQNDLSIDKRTEIEGNSSQHREEISTCASSSDSIEGQYVEKNEREHSQEINTGRIQELERKPPDDESELPII